MVFGFAEVQVFPPKVNHFLLAACFGYLSLEMVQEKQRIPVDSPSHVAETPNQPQPQETALRESAPPIHAEAFAGFSRCPRKMELSRPNPDADD